MAVAAADNVDTSDFESALERAASKRRFVVVEDDAAVEPLRQRIAQRGAHGSAVTAALFELFAGQALDLLGRELGARLVLFGG